MKKQIECKTYSKAVYNDILATINPNLRIELVKNEQKVFRISLMYLGKTGAEAYEHIEIHGSINAVAIFERYRAIGHSLKLRNISVYDIAEDLKIKKVNFKYRDKRETR